ncbi:unnamed protein product [Larinioides sclopetarius]|uniref:Uncharacterized protein n=1 Tax=Larinioides sclopetarius TaxID=280406 RepID=A0AAV2AJE1_9ARAC
MSRSIFEFEIFNFSKYYNSHSFLKIGKYIYCVATVIIFILKKEFEILFIYFHFLLVFHVYGSTKHLAYRI